MSTATLTPAFSIDYPAHPRSRRSGTAQGFHTTGHHLMIVPVLSTVHIPAADRAQLALNDPRDWLAMVGTGEGHIIHFDNGNDYHLESPADFAEDFPPELFTEDFRKLVYTFAVLGYSYLRLDTDGDEIPGLPVYP